jgi:predicted transcriptional regulator
MWGVSAMSVTLLSLVYEGFPSGGSEFDVLLALADSTNEGTGRCDPSVAAIAWKIRQSERTVQYALKKLAAGAWIKQRTGQGKYGTNLYILNRKKLDAVAQERRKEWKAICEKRNAKSKVPTWDDEFGVEIPPDGVQDLQVQKLHPRKAQQQEVQTAANGVQSTVPGGATGCTQTSEPEVNQKEPSLSATSAEAFSQNEKKPTLSDKELIQRAFGFYCIQFGRKPTQYTLTDQRLKKAMLRLKERTEAVGRAQALIEIKTAILNLAASDYHVSNGYIDWTDQIFKSAEEFEKRVNWTPSAQGGQRNAQTTATIATNNDGIGQWLNQTIGGRREAAAAGELPAGVRPVLGAAGGQPPVP